VTTGNESNVLKFGDNIELEAIAEEGWVFLGWSGYGRSGSTSLAASVGRDLKISARFGLPYSTWASSRYGDNPDRAAPDAESEFSGVSNMEYFALGMEYSYQYDTSLLGVRREGDSLFLRYSEYKGLFDVSIRPVQSSDLINWSPSEVSIWEVDETEDLFIKETRFAIGDAESQFYSLLIELSPQNIVTGGTQ
jgi:hypothetical protein